MYLTDGLLKLFRCNSKLFRPITNFILLMNIDPVPVSVVAFLFIVGHVLYSPVKTRTDLLADEPGTLSNLNPR